MSAQAAAEVAKNQSDDAPVLGTKKLSQEARQISGIIENCISQAEVTTTLTAALELKDWSCVVDMELRGALQRYKILAERLTKLEERVTWKENKHEKKERNKAVAQLEKDIKNCVREMIRFCEAHPDAILGLRAELGMKVAESEPNLISGLKVFHGHMVEKLQTSLDEEHVSIVQNLKWTLPQEEKALATSMEKIDIKISLKNHEIKSIQRHLQALEKEDKTLLTLLKKEEEENKKRIEAKRTIVQQEKDKLKVQLNDAMLKNSQAERILLEKNEKVEIEIGNVIQDFDDEIQEIQANLELNEAGYEKEVEELRKLEKAFSVLEPEYNQIQERWRLAEEKQLEEMRELELKTKAAIIAQAWWRGYSTRKALKNKGQSKKPKKGKGKGKKTK